MKRTVSSVLATLALVAGLAPAASADSASDARAARKGPAVSMKTNKTAYTGGDKVRVKGRVKTERGVRRKVQLQAKIVGLPGWETIVQRRTNRRGAYTFRFAAPNPSARGKVKFRVEAVATRSRKVRKAWRRTGVSKARAVTFSNNPAIVRPTYTLALPGACVTETPGVMATTAACVAAMEVQQIERLWLDGRLLAKMIEDPTWTLQMGLEFGSEPDTTAEELAALRIISPYTAEVLPEAAYLASGLSFDDQLMLLFIGMFALDEILGHHFGDVSSATTWRPEWTQKFLLQDLSQVTIAGADATLPTREFKARKKGETLGLTLGGTWKHVAGVWVQVSYPTLVSGARLIG